MFTVKKTIKSVVRQAVFFKGYFRKRVRRAIAIPKQVKVGTVITIDHNKIDEVALVNQNAVGVVVLIDQYKIGDIEFVC